LRIIDLNAQNWKTPLDFYEALIDALYGPIESLFGGAAQGYPFPIGMSVNGFVDSMIWRGMGGIEPPYTVQIISLEQAPKDVIEEVALLASAIESARRERFESQGIDVEVSISY
jgi:hypothetical protein